MKLNKKYTTAVLACALSFTAIVPAYATEESAEIVNEENVGETETLDDVAEKADETEENQEPAEDKSVESTTDENTSVEGESTNEKEDLIDKETSSNIKDNETGYDTKEAAEKAALEALKSDTVNKYYSVSQNPTSKKWFYALSASQESAPATNLATITSEKVFDTKTLAEEAAKKALKENNLYKSYVLKQNEDGKWYYVLSPDESKQEKGSTNLPSSGNRAAGKNAKTGIASLAGITSVLVAASYGYKSTKRK